jgi:hypothetical protein
MTLSVLRHIERWMVGLLVKWKGYGRNSSWPNVIWLEGMKKKEFHRIVTIVDEIRT